MRLGVRGVVVLIREHRLGLFGQTTRHAIIAARVIGLDVRWAHDNLRAKRPQGRHLLFAILSGMTHMVL